jgi:phosphoenolpyruvate-protein phosphotransferase (PTS system enzyme I)
MGARETKFGEKPIEGIAASPGVAMGRVCIHKDILSHIQVLPIEDHEIGNEIRRVQKAVEDIEEAIRNDQEMIRKKVGPKEAEIFSAHLSIIEDSHYLAEIFERIATQKIKAEAAVLLQIRKYEEVFSKVENPYLKDRIADIRDIGTRLLESLMGPLDFDCPFQEPVIIAALELTTKDTLRLKKDRVLAFITEQGGKESHAAILARAMGIPAVLGMEGLLSRIEKGDFLIVDGNLGLIVVNPPEEMIQEYRQIQEKIEIRRENLHLLISSPALTGDGCRFKLMANIGNLADLEFALRYQADGIGLFRTELPFIMGERFLSEEEQFDLYRAVVEKMNPREVTIRTLDLGGDKFLKIPHPEKNPFLGYRSTRFFLKEKRLLQVQLRAILRASRYGKVKILFPMVCSMEEVRNLVRLAKETERELWVQMEDRNQEIPLGVMVEVPSLAILANKLMKEIDFVSIGTNDLVQFTLAVDRDNDLVSDLYQPVHPSVLWLIRNVVEAGKTHGKNVSICGEMAGNPIFFPLLFGLGLREFSVSPMAILEIKEAAKKVFEQEACDVARRALDMDSPGEIAQFLEASSFSERI